MAEITLHAPYAKTFKTQGAARIEGRYGFGVFAFEALPRDH